MRLFLAINIPHEIKNILYQDLINLQKKISHDVKWAKKENWHITLKFIGEVEKRNIDYIKKNMMNIANNTMQQSITFSRVAAFPHLDAPRVIYLGVDKGNRELCNIYNNLGYQLKYLDSKRKEKLYTPHLTLGRVKENSKLEELSRKIKKFSTVDFNNISILVDRISLMNSILKKEGPVYEEIYSANLRGK